MKFTFTIDNFDNQSMADMPESETIRLLKDVAGKVEQGEVSGRLRDVNGNTAGDWEFTDD